MISWKDRGAGKVIGVGSLKGKSAFSLGNRGDAVNQGPGFLG